MVSDEHSGRTAIYTLAATIVAATIAFLGSQWAARTAFDAQMVQIGVNILSADPSKSDVAPARGWAIELVEKHSGQAFSAQDRESLLHHPLDLAGMKAVGLGKSMTLLKCDAFHKKPDGSWEPNPRSGLAADEFMFKYLDAFCNAKADPFGLHFKTG
jgi:hypothetical protein